MAIFKKTFLSIIILGSAIWLLSNPNKRLERVIEKNQPLVFPTMHLVEDREGVLTFNGEQLQYAKNIVQKQPLDVLREFKLEADRMSKSGAKVQRHGDKFFAWYRDKYKKTQGLIVYQYKEASSVVYNLNPLNDGELKLKKIIPIPEDMQQIMFLQASQNNKKSVGIYQSQHSIEMLKDWFNSALTKAGWSNANQVIERKNIENFETFTHEKKNCFIQYEEKNTSTIVTIVVES